MDIQSQLMNAESALRQRQIGHLRRLLEVIQQISSNRFLVSMVQNAFTDVNHAQFQSAAQDIKTAKLIDERDSFVMEF